MPRKKTQERKIDIIEAATDLMIREGAPCVTIKNISQRNHISEAAIYRHFKSKRAILLGVVDLLQERLITSLAGTAEMETDPLTRLKKILQDHLLAVESRTVTMFALTAESIHFNDNILRKKVQRVIRDYTGQLQKLIGQGQEQGSIRADAQPEAVALLFFGLIQASIIQFALTRHTQPPVTEIEPVWSIFMQGLKP